MQRMTRPNRKLWWTVVVLAALAALFAPPAVAGDRLVAHLDEPFEIAGETFDGGTLSVRPVHIYSPVATLNEVCVDQRCLGLMVARERVAEPATRDELIFTRAASGVLVLRGLALAGQPERDFLDVPVPAPIETASASAEPDVLVAEVRGMK